jgi:Ser/Thr protein kinase RdoA (MazF antagonist)
MRADRPFVDAPAGPPAPLHAAARAAASAWHLGEPELVRVGMNGIFAAGDAMLRVSKPTAPGSVAIHLALALAEHGVRVPRPLSAAVLEHDGLSVSAWERIRPSGDAIDWCAVGRHVARVHTIAPAALPPGYPVPSPASFPWWDFERLLGDVDDLLDDASRAGLRRAVDEHVGWAGLLSRDAVVCHGDVHPGNVMQAADGPVLLDWDLLCLAAPAWDHAPMMTWASRWGGHPHEYEAFADGAGWCGRGDALAEALATLRLVAATLMRLRAGRSDLSARDEAERRLRWWRGDPDAPPWQAQ